MGDIFTASGTKVSIGPTVTATEADSAVEFAALTPYAAIGLIETVGEYGDEAAVVTFAAVGDGRMRKTKGARDAGMMALTVAHDGADAGQLELEDAEKTNFRYAFKVEMPNPVSEGGVGEIQYFRGLVTSKRLNIGGNDNVVRNTYNVALDSEVYVTAATAGP